jgi:signal transduction histidine kinase
MSFVSTSRSFDHDDEALAEKIGRLAAPELANAYLYERARQAIRARDRILGIVAHDLQNPLSAIAMSVDLLFGPSLLPDRRAQLLDIIRRSTARMDRLIKDLLDVARIDSEQLQLELAPQSPSQLAREAVDLNFALAADQGLALEFQPPPECSPPVRADRDRILQVLSNLIGNAVKFAPAGGAVVVRLQTVGTETHFSVIDTGPGITKEEQAHLFTPFWRARRHSHDGAGLGLSIAKGLVEGHGGKIWVESDVGRGTTVTFSLPNSVERRKAAKSVARKKSAR